ncbi:hypothetical protein NBRC116594_15890 [Shimia sp. NS0008-38b]
MGHNQASADEIAANLCKKWAAPYATDLQLFLRFIENRLAQPLKTKDMEGDRTKDHARMPVNSG